MTYQSWTDDPLEYPNNRIRPVYFDELQEAINAWETAYSIANTSWTQPDPVSNDIVISASIDEMMDALDSLKTLVDANTFNWTYNASPGSSIRGKDPTAEIAEVRTNMNYIQDGNCYLCHTCDTYSACSCNSTCHSEGCTSCNVSCYSYSCSCNATCYSEASCTCDYTCYSYSKSGCYCNSMCYGYTTCTCDTTCHGRSCSTCYNTCYGETCSCNAACYSYTCTKCDAVDYEYPWS